jgi:hypothetical protein
MQRSTNGSDFASIGNVSSRNQNARSTYSSTDNNPVNGVAYYRLKSVELNGKAGYSKIVSINFSKAGGVSIYPTKWKAGSTLHITNPSSDNLTVYFYSASGRLLGKAKAESNQLQPTFLSTTTGMIFYKVIKEDGSQAGSGTLIAD